MSAENATPVDDGVSLEGVGDDGLVVTGGVAVGAGEAILWPRNPRSASLTCGKTAASGGGFRFRCRNPTTIDCVSELEWLGGLCMSTVSR